jgi:putative ABC transport system substrate-binding protein
LDAAFGAAKSKTFCGLGRRFALCNWLIGGAQQPKKIPVIGFLTGIERATGMVRFAEFRRAIRELGYIEGQNIAIEYRNSEENPDRNPELATELVRLRVDLIVVAAGLPVIQAAKKATTTIPIVMAGRGIDPVFAGLVESLARSGGNVTGLTNLSREIGGKRLELLKEAVPNVRTVAVLYESHNPGSLRELNEILPTAASALGLIVRPVEVRGTSGFDAAIASLNNRRPDAVYVTTSPLMTANLKQIVSFVSKSRLPSIGSNTLYIDAGGLMSYDSESIANYRRVALSWTRF